MRGGGGGDGVAPDFFCLWFPCLPDSAHLPNSASLHQTQQPKLHQHHDKQIAMAASVSAKPPTNGTHSESKSIELAVDLPHSPGLRVNLKLTVLANSILLFLTSSSAESGQGAAAMGSLVYGLPDVSMHVRIFDYARLTPPSEIQPHSADEYCNLHHSINPRLLDTPS